MLLRKEGREGLTALVYEITLPNDVVALLVIACLVIPINTCHNKHIHNNSRAHLVSGRSSRHGIRAPIMIIIMTLRRRCSRLLVPDVRPLARGTRSRLDLAFPLLRRRLDSGARTRTRMRAPRRLCRRTCPSPNRRAQKWGLI